MLKRARRSQGKKGRRLGGKRGLEQSKGREKRGEGEGFLQKMVASRCQPLMSWTIGHGPLTSQTRCHRPIGYVLCTREPLCQPRNSNLQLCQQKGVKRVPLRQKLSVYTQDSHPKEVGITSRTMLWVSQSQEGPKGITNTWQANQTHKGLGPNV